jgi:hypothetical protein
MLLNQIKHLGFVLFKKKSAVRYVKPENSQNFELYIFMVYVFQTYLLGTIPTAQEVSIETQMGRFYVWLIYFIIFYPCFYFKFYRDNNNFLKEVITLSIPCRFQAFAVTAVVSIFLIATFKIFKVPKPPKWIPVYHVLYYIIFMVLMIKCKRYQVPKADEGSDSFVK